MKQITLFFLLLISLYAFSQKKPQEETIDKLKGNVKSVRSITYKAFDKITRYEKGEVEQGTENSLIVYDKQGRVREETHFYSNGNVWWKSVFVYNDTEPEKVEEPSKKTPKKTEEKPKVSTTENLKGKVKYAYNSKGKLSEEIGYDENNIVLWRIIFRYTKDGKIAEIDNYDKKGSLVEREINKYDNKTGHLLENAIFRDNTMVYQCIYTYDEKGNRNHKTEYNTELYSLHSTSDELMQKELKLQGSMLKKYHYTYDNKGNRLEVAIFEVKNQVIEPAPVVVKEEPKKEPTKKKEDTPIRLQYVHTYTEDGNTWDKDYYTFDNKGNITEVKVYDSTEKLMTLHSYTYDHKGNELTRSTYDNENNLIHKSIFSYDDNNNIVEQTEYDREGKILQRSTSAYNDRKMPTSQSIYNPDGSLSYILEYKYDKPNQVEIAVLNPNREKSSTISRKYTYDKKGNWTQKTVFNDGKGETITERTIEYHN